MIRTLAITTMIIKETKEATKETRGIKEAIKETKAIKATKGIKATRVVDDSMIISMENVDLETAMTEVVAWAVAAKVKITWLDKN